VQSLAPTQTISNSNKHPVFARVKYQAQEKRSEQKF